MICVQPSNNSRLADSPKRSQRTPVSREFSLELFPSDDDFFAGGDFENPNSVDWAEEALKSDNEMDHTFDRSSEPQHVKTTTKTDFGGDFSWEAQFDSNVHLSSDSFADLAAKRADEPQNAFDFEKIPPPPSKSPRQARRASLTHVPDSPRKHLRHSPKRAGRKVISSPRASRITAQGKIESNSPRNRTRRERRTSISGGESPKSIMSSSRRSYASAPSVSSPRKSHASPTIVSSPRKSHASPRHSPLRKPQPAQPMTRPQQPNNYHNNDNVLLKKNPRDRSRSPDKQQRRGSAGLEAPARSPAVVATGKYQRRSSTGGGGGFPMDGLLSPRHMMNGTKVNTYGGRGYEEPLVSPPGKAHFPDPIFQNLVVSPTKDRKPTVTPNGFSSGDSEESVVTYASERSVRSPKKVALKPVNKRSPQKERSPRRRVNPVSSDEGSADDCFQRKPLKMPSPFRPGARGIARKTNNLVDLPGLPFETNTMRTQRTSVAVDLSSENSRHTFRVQRTIPIEPDEPARHSMRSQRTSVRDHHDSRSVNSSGQQRKALKLKPLLPAHESDESSFDDAAPKRPSRHRSRSPTARFFP